jgi:hypothetical protein
MLYKTFFYLTLLGSSTAQALSSQPHAERLHSRDVQSLVNIKSSIKHGTDGVVAVDNALKTITAANVKEQLGTVNTLLTKLSSDVSADMKKLKASGTIGIGELLGLVQEAGRNDLIATIGGLFTALNNTAITVGSKRDIIKASGAVDTVVPGIKSLKQGLVDILAIVPSQVPAIAKGPIDGIINSIINGAPKGDTPPGAVAPPGGVSATPPAILRRQTDAKGKGVGGRGGAAKGGAPKGGAAPKASAPKASSGSSGGALENLLASPASQEAIGKAIDGALDQLISWLKGTTENLIPPELADALAKGIPTGAPKGVAPPKAGGQSGAVPPSK